MIMKEGVLLRLWSAMLIFGTIPARVDGQCSASDWSNYGESCYKFINVNVTQNDAEQSCNAMKAYLVSVETMEENNFIKNLIHAEAWLGLERRGDYWFWIDGTTFNYTHWSPDEPGSGEMCARMVVNGMWKGIACGDKYGYVCEQPVMVTTSFPTTPPSTLGPTTQSTLPSPLPTSMSKEPSVAPPAPATTAESPLVPTVTDTRSIIVTSASTKRADGSSTDSPSDGNQSQGGKGDSLPIGWIFAGITVPILVIIIAGLLLHIKRQRDEIYVLRAFKRNTVSFDPPNIIDGYAQAQGVNEPFHEGQSNGGTDTKDKYLNIYQEM